MASFAKLDCSRGHNDAACVV